MVTKTALLVALVSTAVNTVWSSAFATRPNVIVVIVDDLPFLQQWNESAPKGTDLEGESVVLASWPTPNIDAFRSESVIFPKSYCGGPKCAPSRASVLTGRYPSRLQFAIEKTLSDSTGVEGTDVTVFNSKLAPDSDDALFNLPALLQSNGYSTGAVGKWHLTTTTDECAKLIDEADSDLYPICVQKVKDMGFSFVDAYYFSNIELNDDFSHNPEWMVSQSQRFITRAIDDEEPFFLYFASTLTHTPDAREALTEHTMDDSPRGSLTAVGDYPDDTLMSPRDDIWAAAAANGGDLDTRKSFAMYRWMDDMFGALVDFLKNAGVYDDTMIVFQSDHGQVAKGLLYEQGSRMINFVKYPASFGENYVGAVLPQSFVVSNVDLAATIFELADVTLSDDYVMDGTSWLEDVDGYLNSDSSEATNECCTMRFADVWNSHSLQTEHFQYIFRANDNVDTAKGVDELYPNTRDLEQLYDLWSDPNQKMNLFADDASLKLYSDEVTEFQVAMTDYIESTCPVTDAALECVAPVLSFCTSIVSDSFTWRNVATATPALKAKRLQVAKDEMNEDDESCFADGASPEFAYKWTFTRATERLELELVVCCGEGSPMFPGSFVVPDGYIVDDGAAMGVVGDVSGGGEVDTLKIVVVAAGSGGCLVMVCIGGLLIWRRRKARASKDEKVAVEASSPPSTPPTHVADAHSEEFDTADKAVTTHKTIASASINL